MIVTSAFFADYARLHGGRLDVLGGVWDFYYVEQLPAVLDGYLVILVQISPDDQGATVEAALRVSSPSGDVVAGADFSIACGTGVNSSFVIPAPITFNEFGRYVFEISVQDVPAYSTFLLVRETEAG